MYIYIVGEVFYLRFLRISSTPIIFGILRRDETIKKEKRKVLALKDPRDYLRRSRKSEKARNMKLNLASERAENNSLFVTEIFSA